MRRVHAGMGPSMTAAIALLAAAEALEEHAAALRQQAAMEGAANDRVWLGVKEIAFLGDMSARTANRFARRHGVKVQGIWRVPADALAREMANVGKRDA